MLRLLLVISILVPGIVAAIFSRFAGLLLYLWFAFFRPQEWMWIDISFLRPSFVLGLLLFVPSVATGVLPNVSHPLSLGAIGLFAAALLAHTHAFDPVISWYWIIYFFTLLLVCSLAVTLVSDTGRFKLALAVVAGSLGFHAAKAGLVSMLGGGVRYFDGLAGSYGDNNGYAVAMVMIFPLLLATGQCLQHWWIRKAFLLAAPLAAVGVVSTFSRGGFLALAVGALTLAFLQRRRALAAVALAAVALPVGVFMTAQEGYLERLQSIQVLSEDDTSAAERDVTSTISRLHFWNTAVDMANANPLGVGLFNYDVAYDQYDTTGGRFGSRRSVHSSHFQVLAETGFLGAAIWILLFAMAFRCAFRVRRRARHPGLSAADQRLFFASGSGLIASMAGFLVGGAFVAMALNDLTWVTFALVAALDRISAQACEAADRQSETSTTVRPQSFETPRIDWSPAAWEAVR